MVSVRRTRESERERGRRRNAGRALFVQTESHVSQCSSRMRSENGKDRALSKVDLDALDENDESSTLTYDVTCGSFL